VSLTAIDHVQLAAPPGCELEARRFYGELLGLRELPKPEPLKSRGGVWFAVGPAQQLHIGIETGHTPVRKAHPAFAALDADALHALAVDLDAAGHPVRWDDDLPGTKRFYVDDPWGNRIELLAQS
jgi:catechol 2,3-dioxygenase-like lactoylglutathione lyase family enzyme